MANEVWTIDPFEIKQEAAKFFEKKYGECWLNRPLFRSSGIRKLSNTDAQFLEGKVSIVEVKNALWSCGGDKSPGPDGFNFKFLKKYRDFLEDDIVGLVKYFEVGGKITTGFNSFFYLFSHQV